MNSRSLTFAAAVLAAFLGSSMAENNLFTDDFSSWALKSSGEASASSNVTTQDGKDILCVEISDIPENPAKVSDVRISQPSVIIDGDQTYRINFQAKADNLGQIVIFVYPENDPRHVLFRRDITVGLDWKDYVISFVSKDPPSQCTWGFAGLGRTNNRYYFRKIPE